MEPKTPGRGLLEQPLAVIGQALVLIGTIGLVWIWGARLSGNAPDDFIFDAKYYMGTIGLFGGGIIFFVSRHLQKRRETRANARSVGNRTPTGRSAWVSDDLFVSLRRGSLGFRLPAKMHTEWLLEVNGNLVRDVEPKGKASIPFQHDGKQYVIKWSSWMMDSTPKILFETADGQHLAPVNIST